MVAVMVVIVSIYLSVELGLPGYELSKTPNADHPSDYVGVILASIYSSKDKQEHDYTNG